MTRTGRRSPSGLRLGLRANLARFCLLVGVNALVGGMVGQERTVPSLLVRGGLPVGQVGLLAALYPASAMLLGAGTAMVYPTLLAAIGDVAHPS